MDFKFKKTTIKEFEDGRKESTGEKLNIVTLIYILNGEEGISNIILPKEFYNYTKTFQNKLLKSIKEQVKLEIIKTYGNKTDNLD